VLCLCLALAASIRAAEFRYPVVTQLIPLAGFYPAEDGHQDFVARNPNHSYVVFHDLPKLARLKQKYPELVGR
jgi:peptide-methionine (S)-S-oxide reductase